MDTNDKPAAGDLRRSVSIAALTMTASVMLSRIIGLVREGVLSHLAGTSVSMDAYVAAFLIPEILNHILAGGFLSVTFIPIFQRYLVKGEHETSWRVFSNLLTVGSVVMGLLIVAGMIFAGDLLVAVEGVKHHGRVTARGAEWIPLTVKLTRIILPAQIFFYWGSFLMAVQYAHKRFFWPAMMPLCYNVGIIAGGILLYRYVGVEGFAWGVVAGAFVGGVVCQLPGCIKLGLRFRPVFDLKDPDLRKYVLLSLPFVVGLGMTFSNEVLFRAFAISQEPGALAFLNYALRVMMILVGVFGLAFASASFPFQSQLAAENRIDKMNELSNGIISRTCALLIPLSGIMFVLSKEIITALFQHGRFTAASTTQTAPLLSLYLVGACAFAANSIVVRNYYAVQNTLYPMIVSTVTVAASVPLYWILSATLGTKGIALAASISLTVQFAVLYFLWSHANANVPGMMRVMWILTKVAVATIVGSLVCFGIRALVAAAGVTPAQPLLSAVVGGTVAAVPSLLLIFVILEKTGVQTLRDALRLLTRKAR